jgi:hypothetical protein
MAADITCSLSTQRVGVRFGLRKQKRAAWARWSRRLRDQDSNLDYLGQNQAGYHYPIPQRPGEYSLGPPVRTLWRPVRLREFEG